MRFVLKKWNSEDLLSWGKIQFEMETLCQNAHWGIWNDGQRGPAVYQRELFPVFCDNIHGKTFWERIDMCVYVYDWVTLLHRRNYYNLVN